MNNITKAKKYAKDDLHLLKKFNPQHYNPGGMKRVKGKNLKDMESLNPDFLERRTINFGKKPIKKKFIPQSQRNLRRTNSSPALLTNKAKPTAPTSNSDKLEVESITSQPQSHKKSNSSCSSIEFSIYSNGIRTGGLKRIYPVNEPETKKESSKRNSVNSDKSDGSDLSIKSIGSNDSQHSNTSVVSDETMEIRNFDSTQHQFVQNVLNFKPQKPKKNTNSQKSGSSSSNTNEVNSEKSSLSSNPNETKIYPINDKEKKDIDPRKEDKK